MLNYTCLVYTCTPPLLYHTLPCRNALAQRTLPHIVHTSALPTLGLLLLFTALSQRR